MTRKNNGLNSGTVYIEEDIQFHSQWVLGDKFLVYTWYRPEEYTESSSGVGWRAEYSNKSIWKGNFIYEGDTLDLFNKPKDEISKLNYIYKWNSLKQDESIKNIVEKEFKSDGLLFIVKDAKEKLFKEVERNLILSNEANSLKKFNLILNKYKTFKDLLRKVLDEC